MKAILRGIRIAPKKANLVAGMVRGLPVDEALSLLKFTPKKGADILYKVIHSAASNAKHNFKQSFDDLVVSRIIVNQGPTLKRSLPISRGRTHPILKKTSHILVEVSSATPEAVDKPVGEPIEEPVEAKKNGKAKKVAAPKAGKKEPKAKKVTSDQKTATSKK